MHGAVQWQGLFLALSSLSRFFAQVFADFGTLLTRDPPKKNLHDIIFCLAVAG
jgi:hypothetical protein